MKLKLVMSVLLIVLISGCVSISEPPDIDESAYMEGEARVY